MKKAYYEPEVNIETICCGVLMAASGGEYDSYNLTSDGFEEVWYKK